MSEGKTSKRRSKKILIVLVIVLALIIGGIYLIHHYLNGASTGAISVGQPTTRPDQQFPCDMTPASVSNPYSSFTVPKCMNFGKVQKPVAPVLTHYSLSHLDIQSWNLAIEIDSLPEGNINNSNSYQYRKTNPAQYVESQLSVNGRTADVMTAQNQGGYSKVAYLVHGSMIASISLTGDDPNGSAPLTAVFKMVIGSWLWH